MFGYLVLGLVVLFWGTVGYLLIRNVIDFSIRDHPYGIMPREDYS